MKKLLSVLLVLVMVFSLAACGSGDICDTGADGGGAGGNSAELVLGPRTGRCDDS